MALLNESASILIFFLPVHTEICSAPLPSVSVGEPYPKIE